MDPLTARADQKSDDSEIVRTQTAGAGRIGAYTALGALSGVMALPFVPDTLAKRVRGALAQDLCARFGIALTPEARAVLCEPEGDKMRNAAVQAIRFVAIRWLKRVSPLGFLPPVRTGFTTYALGHVLERYLARHRRERATRMDVEEARKLRSLIDKTLAEVFRTDLPMSRDQSSMAQEDLRDGFTQIVDGVVITLASVPELIARRLDAAFDAVVKREGA